MTIRVNAFGKTIAFPAGTSPEDIEKHISSNRALLDPEYKAPETGMLGKAAQFGKEFAQNSLGVDMGIDTSNQPTGQDYLKGFASGANKLVSGIGYLAEVAGAKDTGKSIREFGDRGAAYWNNLMSAGGKQAAADQVFEDDEDSITGLRLSDNWGNALLMGASQSAPSMFAAAVPGALTTSAIQKLASLGLAGGSGATIPLLAGTAAPVGVASNVIARTPAAIGFGSAEGITAGAMNAADLKSSIEGMPLEEKRKSPVYLVLEAEHGEEKATQLLAEQAASDVFGRTAVSTGVIGALTGGGALGQAYQKATGAAKGGLLNQTIKGSAQEAIQEAPQSGMEKLIENVAVRDYLNPEQDIMEGVMADAASGAAIGGLMGGVVGGGGAVKLSEDRAARINDERTRLGLNKIASSETVDEAINAAAETVSQKPVTPSDIWDDQSARDDLLMRASQINQQKGVQNEAQVQGTEASAAETDVLGAKPAETLLNQAVANDGLNSIQSQAQLDNEAPASDIIAQNLGNTAKGAATEIILPDNTTLPAEWMVVDADNVKATMKNGINQPRDRTRAAADVQIQQIANQPDYRRMSDSPVMDIGAPTLSSDGAIVGGNGRFEGVSRGYDAGTSAAYRAALEADAVKKGIDPATFAGMKKPVLVRRVTQPFDTQKLAVASNSGGSLEYSALERAKIDAERIGDIDQIEVTDSGDIVLTKDNAANIRNALKGYSASELGSFVDNEGNLSQEGSLRLKNAILYSAYGNSKTLSRMVESTDTDMRNIVGALTKTAGQAARVRKNISQGGLPKSLDITDNLIEAVEKIGQIRSSGDTVDNYLTQGELFSDIALSEETKEIMTGLSDVMRSQKRMTEFLSATYDLIEKVDVTTENIFGEPDIPKKLEVIKHAKQQTAEQRPGSLFGEESGKESAAKVNNVTSAEAGAKYSRSPEERLKDRERSRKLERALKREGYDFRIQARDVRLGITPDGKGQEAIAAEQIARIFRKRISWIEADGDFKINGVMVPSMPDTIFIDVNTNKAAHIVMGHELSHHMEQDVPEVYQAMVDALMPMIRDVDAYHASRKLDDMKQENVIKEIVGDIMGDNFADPEFWNKVAAYNPNAFRKIADTIISWIKRLVTNAKARGLGSQQWVTDAQKARDIVAKAVSQYTYTESSFDASAISSKKISGSVKPDSKRLRLKTSYGGNFDTIQASLEVADKFIKSNSASSFWSEVSSTKKDKSYSLITDSEVLANVSESAPVIKHGFGGIDIPSKRVMFGAMSRMLKNSEVRNLVIESVPIDVVNMLTGGKIPPDVLFHDMPMLFNLLSVNGNKSISASRNAASETASVIAAMGAKATVLKVADGPNKLSSALLAREGNFFSPALHRAVKNFGGFESFITNAEDFSAVDAGNFGHNNRKFVEYDGDYNTIFDDKDVEITAKFSKAGNRAKDEEYLSAVNSGDLEKAQKMVDSAAREKGYISGDEYRMMHQAPNREDYNLSTIKEAGIVPDDYWTHPHYYQSDVSERESFQRINSAIDRQKRTGRKAGLAVYRAVPKDVKDSSIRNGDWVSPSREYARGEGESIPGGYRIISAIPNIDNLWWDANSINELGYDDGKEYAYKNTKNNRKLIDAVTYDDNGDIVPLSKRFNQKSDDVRFSKSDRSAQIPDTITIDGKERPTRNSNGKLIHPTDEGIRNFWEWFGDSKVVDDQGRPLVVYHGSNVEFDNFDDSKRGSNFEDEASKYNYFFTSDKDEASFFGENVKEFYLKSGMLKKITDDAISDESQSWLNQLRDEDPDEYDFQINTKQYQNSEGINKGYELAILAANNGGYKSTEYQNEYENKWFTVMSANQIKSATGNTGQFSPDSDDIRFSREVTEDNQKIMLFTGSPKVINEIVDDGVFGGLFASTDRDAASSHGNYVHTIELNSNDIADNAALANAENINYLINDNINGISQDEFDDVYNVIVNNVSLFDSNIPKNRISDLFVYDDIGEADWYAQRIRGQIAKELGYKAVEMQDEHGKSYLVLPGTEIKEEFSKFSRSDTLSQAGVNTEEAAKPSSLPEETKTQAFRRRSQDAMLRFKVVQNWLKEQGVNLSEAANVYQRENISKGKAANKIEDFRREQLEPLIRRIAETSKKATGESKFDLADIATYLEAIHIPEANERMRTIHKDDKATANGITDDQARKVVKQFESMPNFAEFKKLSDDVRKIGIDTLDMRLDAGLISQEQYDAYKSTYKNWVPLRGNMSKQGFGKGMSTNAKDKRRMGHGFREEEFVIENLVQDRERAIMQIEKNKVGLSVAAFLMEAMNSNIGTVGNPEKMRVMKDFSYAVTFKGRTVGSFETEAGAKSAIDRIMERRGDLVPEGESFTQTDFGIEKSYDPHIVMMARPQLAENEIQVYVNGHAVRLQLNDTGLARAATNAGIEQVGAIAHGARMFNRFLSKAYTAWSPDFLFMNMARDAYSGTLVLTGKKGAAFVVKTFTNYGTAIRELIKGRNEPKRSKWVTEYREDGGNIGAAYLSDLDRIGEDAMAALQEFAGARETYRMVYNDQISRGASVPKARTMAGLKAGVAKSKSLPVVGHLIGKIETVNMVLENALRLATYMTARQEGETRQQAAMLSKDLMNFNRKGEIANQMGALYLFYNPGMQGAHIVGEALFTSKHRKQVWALLGALTTLSFILAEFARGGEDDDDREWENTPDYIKDRNLIFQFGDKQITVPVAYGFGIFHAMGNYLSDLNHGADKSEIAVKLASGMFENFSVFGNPIVGDDGETEIRLDQILPTLPKLIMGPGINMDSLGRQIQPDKASWNQSVPDSQNMFRSVRGTVYEDIAHFMNDITGGSKYNPGAIDISPNTIKYWVTSLTGGAGRFVSDITTGSLNAAEGVSPEIENVPVLRKFVRQPGVSDSRAAFHKARKEAQHASERFDKALKNGDVFMSQQMLDENHEIIALANYAKQASKMAAEARDAIMQIQLDKDISKPEKKVRIKEIELQEQRVYDMFLEIFDKSKNK